MDFIAFEDVLFERSSIGYHLINFKIFSRFSYAWQIMCCSECHYHVGWKFTACKERLIPRTFYALKNDAVKVKRVKPETDIEPVL